MARTGDINLSVLCLRQSNSPPVCPFRSLQESRGEGSHTEVKRPLFSNGDLFYKDSNALPSSSLRSFFRLLWSSSSEHLGRGRSASRPIWPRRHRPQGVGGSAGGSTKPVSQLLPPTNGHRAGAALLRSAKKRQPLPMRCPGPLQSCWGLREARLGPKD